ncbi:helix-turn-helix domain-containing protein [Vampirovibrio sp.]|uniref:helix-turn-helix domain-containing protein n=1 Tax=Vampirovibrio sp. TaxID=2717857 RepID=UPI0035946CB0
MQKTFGPYIRQVRLQRGNTLRGFARAVQLSPNFVSSMERGLVPPPSEPTIQRIAELLAENPDELLAMAGKISPDLVEIILQKPRETATLLRRLNHAPAHRRKAVIYTKAADDPLEFYPLEDISRENHTAVIGESGSGKSFLTRYLIQAFFQQASIRVYDSDAAPSDWPELEVLGRKGDYSAIAQNMQADLEELQHRTSLHGDGQDVGQEIVRVIEEYPSTAAELAEILLADVPADIGVSWLRKLLRRGRKYRMKVFAVAQEFEVNAWKISGEGGLRRAFTVLYLGATAYKALSQVKDAKYREQLQVYLDKVKYPCLVDVKSRFYPVEIPDLTKK